MMGDGCFPMKAQFSQRFPSTSIGRYIKRRSSGVFGKPRGARRRGERIESMSIRRNQGTVASGHRAYTPHHVSRPGPGRVLADLTEPRGKGKEDTKRQSEHPKFWVPPPHGCPPRRGFRPLKTKYLK